MTVNHVLVNKFLYLLYSNKIWICIQCRRQTSWSEGVQSKSEGILT